MAGGVILCVGAGRCGLMSMVHVLNQQPDVGASLREPPILPWARGAASTVIADRIRRMRKSRPMPWVADAAPFYLPYLEDAIAAEPGVRIVGLRRSCDEVVASYCRWFDDLFCLPMNHWAKEPPPGWHHDPIWTQSFPQYDTKDRSQGLRRYWHEYYETLDDLARRHPETIRVFEMDATLNTEAGQRARP